MWKREALLLPLSVDNVVLKATRSLSGYKYLPPPPPPVDHSMNAGGEKHVLLLWTRLSKSSVLFMPAPPAVAARLLRACRHLTAAADGADGQLWRHDSHLWGDVWPPDRTHLPVAYTWAEHTAAGGRGGLQLQSRCYNEAQSWWINYICCTAATGSVIHRRVSWWVWLLVKNCDRRLYFWGVSHRKQPEETHFLPEAGKRYETVSSAFTPSFTLKHLHLKQVNAHQIFIFCSPACLLLMTKVFNHIRGVQTPGRWLRNTDVKIFLSNVPNKNKDWSTPGGLEFLATSAVLWGSD